MLDNPGGGGATVKRYIPPQRNRLLSRRKSGDRAERVNNLHGNDGEKTIISSRNIHATEHEEAGGSNLLNENPHPGLIAVDGSCRSKASELMNERWTSAMRSYNDLSVDATERPIMYSGSGGSAWGSSKLPYQMDFAVELRHAIQSATAGKMSKATELN